MRRSYKDKLQKKKSKVYFGEDFIFVAVSVQMAKLKFRWTRIKSLGNARLFIIEFFFFFFFFFRANFGRVCLQSWLSVCNSV